jgi:hypothetical protein
VPINFDRDFTSLQTLTIHSNLTNFKYRPRAGNDAYLENGIVLVPQPDFSPKEVSIDPV